MSTDEEKRRIQKLLHGIEIPEVKLTERCFDLVKDFHKKFDEEIEDEEKANATEDIFENPYKVDKKLMDETERKLRELLSKSKRPKPNPETNEQKTKTQPDPKRPWRTNSNKEKLLRIDSDLKQHLEKASQLIEPMCDQDMMELVKTCREETLASAPVSANRLQDTVDAARRNLTNFQYRKIDNTTATSILPAAHLLERPSESHEDTPNTS